MIQTTSTAPSFSALSAADPAKGKNVAFSAFMPPLPRICSAVNLVALPTGPTAIRLPLSCDSSIKLLVRGIENPERLIVDGAQRKDIGRMFGVGNAAGHEANLYARLWILQKLDVFNRAGGLAQFQIDVIAREYFSILPAVIVERRAFESRGHDNLRRRRGNEMDQGKGNNARQCQRWRPMS